MQEQLKIMTPAKGTTAEKVLAYNRANAAVAVLCNHKKGITLNHGAQMEKAVNKVSTNPVKNVASKFSRSALSNTNDASCGMVSGHSTPSIRN